MLAPPLRYDADVSDAAKKLATYDDVLRAPAHMVAELIHGRLSLLPRPAFPHARAASTLGEELGPPFNRGRGGPGGWIILDEPELHLGPHVLVPDLAGWRRERMPEMPEGVFTELAPDWLCEVLSPSTARLDRADKLPVYAEHGVAHVWLVDPAVKTLECLALDGRTYRLLKTYSNDDRVRADPFATFELELALLWQR